MASRRGLSAPSREPVPLEPVRKSLRLQKIDADTGLQLPDKEPTSYRIVDDEPQRPPLTDLTLEELENNNEDWEVTAKYFSDKVQPFLSSKKSTAKKSIFDNPSTLGSSIKALKITVSYLGRFV